MSKYDMITILGATAGGKTSFATALASQLETEIISADSRQVYRNMDIGTGKDIEEYVSDGKAIPYHLINIADAGDKYNVYRYQADFKNVYSELKQRKKMPILCGGTGMYIESVLKGYRLINVPLNESLRKELEDKSDEELKFLLSQTKKQHNISDTSVRKRMIRAIEIALYYDENPQIDHSFPKINSLIFEVSFDRETRRKRITERLYSRIKEGMIEETKQLLNSGIPAETLIYYGLEYKFITMHISGELSLKEMTERLNIAIHQFSKRQLTWFRKMERNGFKIHKIDGKLSSKDKVEKALELVNA